MPDKSYFVWIKSVYGKTFPRKYYDGIDKGPDHKAYFNGTIISKHKLNKNHINMSLNDLSMEFPLI
jgi:hypothetical protein